MKLIKFSALIVMMIAVAAGISVCADEVQKAMGAETLHWQIVPEHTFWDGYMGCDGYGIMAAWHLADGTRDWHGVTFTDHLMMTVEGWHEAEDCCRAVMRAQ